MIGFEDFAGQVEGALAGDAAVTIRRAPRAAHPGTPIQAADHFVSSLGFVPLGDRWFDLNDLPSEFSRHSHAVEYLADALLHDMVHSSYEWVPQEIATAYARVFSAYFDQGEITWLSNRVGNGWNPITRSTMEAAFVVIDDLSVGLFLIEAED